MRDEIPRDRNWNAWIYGVLLVVVGAVWIASHLEWTGKSLAVNLLPEAISAAFTAIVVDQLIKFREAAQVEAREVPRRWMAFRAVAQWYARVQGLWITLYNEAVSADVPHDIEEVWSLRTASTVWDSLDLEQPATYFRGIPWKIALPQHCDNLARDAERILDSHGHYLDPKVAALIYTLRDGALLNYLPVSVRVAHGTRGMFASTSALASCAYGPDEDELKTWIELFRWLETHRDAYRKHGFDVPPTPARSATSPRGGMARLDPSKAEAQRARAEQRKAAGEKEIVLAS